MRVLIVDGLQMKFHEAYLMALTVLSPGCRAVVSLWLLEMPHLLLASCFAHKRAVPGQSFMGFQIFLCDIPIFQRVDKVLRFCGMVYFKGTLIFLTRF